MTGDISQLQLKRVNNFSFFLEDLIDLVSLKTDGLINAELLFAQANELIETNNNLPQLQWLNDMQLSLEDKLVFLISCHRYYTNSDSEEDVMVISILDDIMDDTSDKFKYKKTFRNDENKLVLNNLIEADTDWMITSLAYRLTKEAKDTIFEIEATNRVIEYRPRKGSIIKNESLIQEELFYNTSEARQVELLQNALLEENFKKVCTKLSANNLKAGFTILLYGEAGTGKTATAKQLAKLSGRNIFSVEVNKIKNPYVGETEKSMKEVFVEYRKLCKLYDKTPILLFNEADAIISKRITVQRSVDQMNNSMQNILLQELEDFEGIFIATTNLAENLDDAFDRRFLYKIEYKKPQPDIRLKILKNNFKEIEEDILYAINEKYSLTGGQIMNLKKKLLVQNLLEQKNLNDMIWMACEDEMSLNKNTVRTQIGFIKN